MATTTVINGEDQLGDLPELMDILTTAVTTLDAVGADAYRDVYLYVSGCRAGEPVTELAIERGELWVSAAGTRPSPPSYRRGDDEGDRRALLIAQLVFAMWHWRVTDAEVARYLGCARPLLDRWIAAARDGDRTSVVPASILNDVRRFVIVEAERHILGVPDHATPRWVRESRAELGGRSVLGALFNDGEVGFRSIQCWMMDGIAAPSATIH